MWQPLSVCASDVCAQKTVYQKFKLIWFKIYDFQRDRHDNQNQTDIFWQKSEVRAVKAQSYSGKGGGEQQLICIKFLNIINIRGVFWAET